MLKNVDDKKKLTAIVSCLAKFNFFDNIFVRIPGGGGGGGAPIQEIGNEIKNFVWKV